MQTLSGQRVFTVGQTSYVWEDVILAGLLWGDWTALEERVRSGLACLARLDDLDDDDDDALDEADVETAAAEFRYARDLVAAADLETWLERRGLSVEAWLDFIRRGLLSTDQIARVIDRQTKLQHDGSRLQFGQVAYEMGYITRSQLDGALSDQRSDFNERFWD